MKAGISSDFGKCLGSNKKPWPRNWGMTGLNPRFLIWRPKKQLIRQFLDQVAKVLKVPVEAIKNFDEEAAIVNIQNNYDGSTLNHSANYQYNYQPTFNPVDKVVELYERLLKEKDAEIETLKKQAGKKK